MDIYQGDPKIIIDENGADMIYPGDGGQPEMEQGVENQAIISLFTDEGWEGNYYLKNKDQKVGSNYRDTAEKPITLSNLELIRQSTINALSSPVFGEIESIVTTPSSGQIRNGISITPRGKNQSEIILQKNGLNWVMQAKKGQN
jgi:hypothetical protein